MHLAHDPPFDFSFSNMEDVKLTGAEMTGIELASADLERADLNGANLSSANLRDADLTEATLEGAILTGANMRGVVMRDANLVNATLRRADLRGADLAGARIAGADFTGAMLDESATGAADSPAEEAAETAVSMVVCPNGTTVPSSVETDDIHLCSNHLDSPADETSSASGHPKLFVGASLPLGAPIGRVVATDVDNDDVSFRIDDPHGPFSIDAATGILRIRSPLEPGMPYDVEVSLIEARIDGEPPAEETKILVEVVVDAENHPPTSILDLIVPVGTPPETIVAVLGNGDHYELVGSIESFRIEDKTLQVAGALEPGTYQLSAEERDSSNNILNILDFRVTVTLPNSAPVIISPVQVNPIDVATQAGETVVSVEAQDADEDTLRFAIERVDWSDGSCRSDTAFVALVENDWPVSINPESGEIVVVRPPTTTGCARLAVRVTDSRPISKFAQTLISLSYTNGADGMSQSLVPCHHFSSPPC